ncbi:MAG: recombinase family protein [Solirubrobacteraceae bacterium]
MPGAPIFRLRVDDVTATNANCWIRRLVVGTPGPWSRPRRPPPGHRHLQPVGRMFFQILGAIAEFEHALMFERNRDGLEAAPARGRTGGQKPKLTPRQAKIAQAMHDELGPDRKRVYTVQQVAAGFGVTRPTIYRHLQPGN